MTYHFAAGKPLPAGWRLFFHLEGPVGYRNLDHVPVDGLMPLERWRPGQTLRDRQRIPIPAGTPRGTYTLYLGAYRGAERLPVTPASLNDGKDRLRLFSFTVTPSTASADRVRTRRKGSRGNARCRPRDDSLGAAVETPPSRLTTRAGLAALAAVSLLALVETASAIVAPYRAPSDEDWRAAAGAIRAGFRAGRPDRRGPGVGGLRSCACTSVI